MRIALLTHALPPDNISGIGRYVEDLAAGFAKQGHEVVVLSVSRIGKDLEEKRADFLVSWIPDIPTSTIAPFFRLIRLSARMYKRLQQLHRQQPFDVIEAPNTWASGLVSFWRGFPQSPLRTTRLSTPRAWFHHTTPWLPRLTEWLEYLQVAKSDLVISNTRENLELSRTLYPIKNRKTVVVYHGIPDTQSAPTTAKQRNEFSVLYVGRMEHRKGFDILAEAWPLVLDEIPRAKLHVIGEDLSGPEDTPSYFEWAIRALSENQRESIHFHGKVGDEERNRLFIESSTIVVPSRYESFGLVLLEAMIRGKPVVANAVGGIKEVVEHGKTGLLVTPESREELAFNIISLLRNPMLCMRLGENARFRVLERFTVEKMAAGSIDAYRQAIGTSR